VTRYLAAVFILGIAAIVAGGIRSGFDMTTVVLLLLAIALAVVGVAAARRFSSGAVCPAQCSQCGGLLAPSSPYCKHCGAPR
jgi:hypothetical protein